MINDKCLEAFIRIYSFVVVVFTKKEERQRHQEKQTHNFLLIIVLFVCESYFVFINYNTIKNYIQIIYKQGNVNHVLGVVSQPRVSSGNRIHNPHANTLAISG